ncbi:MAG: serine/threonine-protein kinase [Anaerolineae bacterium]|nr:serine/threonine-protein kinase [Anaerolineae bacterium]
MALTPGTLINDRYRVVSILGQGGMGSVYRAIDEHLGISVAVKENLFLSDDYARQFQREASILANLRHHNLPRVGDYFAIPGQGQYLIMEYIDGEDLRQRIERLGKIPEREVILIGIIICNALSYLHSRTSSVVHRDIKPGNIKITPEGEVVLVDFGLAKVMQGTQTTTTGARAMTPGYSPPEQYGTARTDARSDIYSLGATLYAALSGTIPEDGLARATGKTKLTPLRQLEPDVSRKVALVIEKALEVEPEDRYQSAKEFKLALVEASELSLSELQDLVINPPPLEGEEVSPSGEERSSFQGAAPFNKRLAGTFRRFYRRFQRSALTPLSLFILLIVVIALLLLRSPLFSPPVARNATMLFEQPAGGGTIAAVAGTVAFTPEPSPTLAAPLPTDTPVSMLTTATAIVQEANNSPTSYVAAGKIAFTSDRTGSMQVWLMNADGSEQQQLTSFPEGACQPSFSPDGTKLAIISPCKTKLQIYNDSKIYIINADGSDPRLLAISSGGDFDPAWSPDGARIAFTSVRTGVAHVYVYHLQNGSIGDLSDTIFPDMQPAWSPSGKQLAVSRKGNYNNRIWMISENGQTQFQFSAPGNVNDYYPDWSSDGEFLIYSRSGIDPAIPYLHFLSYAERGTGADKPILPKDRREPVPSSGVSIAPDSKTIVFESWPDGRNHDIYRMDVTGEALTRLTNDPGFDYDPEWCPVQP